MSDVGDDTYDIAALALESVEGGRFAATPPGWDRALRDRVKTLATGRAPTIPVLDEA